MADSIGTMSLGSGSDGQQFELITFPGSYIHTYYGHGAEIKGATYSTPYVIWTVPSGYQIQKSTVFGLICSGGYGNFGFKNIPVGEKVEISSTSRNTSYGYEYYGYGYLESTTTQIILHSEIYCNFSNCEPGITLTSNPGLISNRYLCGTVFSKV